MDTTGGRTTQSITFSCATSSRQAAPPLATPGPHDNKMVAIAKTDDGSIASELEVAAEEIRLLLDRVSSLRRMPGAE